MSNVGRHIQIRGTVQGVGFRPWVYQLARREGVGGRVRNDSSGVVIEAFGDDVAIEVFTLDLARNLPPAARVREMEWEPIPYEDVAEFAIVASERGSERNVSVPPDLATCDQCVGEVFDPADRRYLYPFTNCTNCGPRYTIVRDVPYDRDKTTMARFAMCDACRREYDDPLNRRFHAQPNACPACGPRVTAVTPQGRQISTVGPLGFAARTINAQMTVAIKGLGGFHLACDATSPIAVGRLRERKHRDAKPMAVMVRDIEAARSIAHITEKERALLESPERPIVLVEKIATAQIAGGVAGDSPLIGLMLPYTPLHHILLRECDKPLVMTSGNLSDEPMATTNADALARLADVADLFLLHDREIETRADDSVARVIDGSPVVFRRSRGFVPRAVAMRSAFAEPVLAVGAHLKNAVCIGSGKSAFLGPHNGDLESYETLRSFEAGVEQMKKLVGVDPRVVAHDLHPDYFSTRFAAALEGVRLVGVQHHHAHIASAMAEHGLYEPVIGVAYDGTGYGTDGTSWGGEILIATLGGYERFATFRPIPLAGGDHAIRQVWRIALAVLDDAFGGEPPLDALALFNDIDPARIESVRRMIGRQFNSPLARGVGRYFDALGAMGLSLQTSRYEGEVAQRWSNAAERDERGRYEVAIHEGAVLREIDLRPLVRSAVADLTRGISPAVVSARFHNALAGTTVEIVRAAADALGPMPVVLSGGCFQNARLAESIAASLRGDRRVLMNRQIPPGDGGLALGQAVVANAILRESGGISQMQQMEPVCV
jgi:hydrogenase maturation protein HypF